MLKTNTYSPTELLNYIDIQAHSITSLNTPRRSTGVALEALEAIEMELKQVSISSGSPVMSALSSSSSLGKLEPEAIMQKEMNPRAQANWKKACGSVQSLVKGAFTNSIIIHESYYSEVLDKRHEYARNHADYFDTWSNSSTNLNYFDFIEQYRRPISKEDIDEYGQLLISDPESLVTDRINQIKPEVDLNKMWVFTGYAASTVSVGVQQFTQAESKKQFGVELQGNSIIYSKDYNPQYLSHIQKRAFPPSSLIFVSDKEGLIYAGFKIRGLFHHSSFLSGAPVAMAGTLTVNTKGKLIEISNASGHYQTKADDCYRFLKKLDDSGIGFSQVKFLYLNKSDEVAFIGKATDWLQRYESKEF